MKKQKEIVPFIIDKIENGGAERVIIRLANYFNSDVDAHLFTAVNSSGFENFNLGKIKVHYSDVRKDDGFFSKSKNIFSQILKLKKFVELNRCKKVISFLDRSNFVCVIVSKLTGAKSIVSVRNNISYQYSSGSFVRKKLSMILLKTVYTNADIVVALSKGVKEQLVSVYGVDESKVKVIYNPYPIRSMYNQGNDKKDLMQDVLDYKVKGYFVSVGRLSYQKDHDVLLECYSRYRNLGGSNMLLILGSGELERNLHGKISDLNLVGSVVLLGYRSDTLNIIANSNGFLFTSRWEGFGNACLEAIAVGTPVVSSDCDFGPKEIFGLENVDAYPCYTSCGILTLKLEPQTTVALNQFVDAMLYFDENSKSFNKNDLLERSLAFDEGLMLGDWGKVIVGEQYTKEETREVCHDDY
jgi:glycosyltransferase involved in cell wall biosynthesis